MFQLTGRINRIARYDNASDLQGGCIGNRELWAIGKVDRDPIPLVNAQFLQCCSESVHHFHMFAIGYFIVLENMDEMIRMVRRSLFQSLWQCHFRIINVLRYMGLVG